MNEELDVAELHASLGVRDQGDRELVNPWIANERTIREHGQRAVVATRQTLVDFPDVLAHDVKVVQKPLASWPDVTLLRRDRGQPIARVVEQDARVHQAREERSANPAWTSGG